MDYDSPHSQKRFRFLFPAVLFVGIILTPLLKGEVSAGTSPSVEGLLSLASAKGLDQERYWWILLHYRKTLFGVESQVDDPAFFLSKDGKTDPNAELTASIQAFFQPDRVAAESIVCRFYARYRWLRETLAVDPDAFPELLCKKIQQIKPKSATLVFPTYYMNSPASMFGHTLLTIETEYTSKRLADAVNYAALAYDANGLSFAFKGLFGFYKGYYTVLPYGKKIREYSDMDQRDIWEYELNLTPAEIERMIWHIKELDQIYTDYYFFDENCSYNILFLLEAARPEVRLTDRFFLSVVPIDTVKAVIQENMVSDVVFRPSKAAQLKHKIASLDSASRTEALRIICGERAPADVLDSREWPDEEKIRILDLVNDHIQYLYSKDKMTREEYQCRLMESLRVRSKLGKAEFPFYEEPVPPRPDQGHDSKRISLGMGSYDGDLFYEIGFRPTFNDLLESDHMEKDQGAQIEFGHLRLRHYPEESDFQIHQFNIIDIVSISPRDDFLKPISWMFNTGFNHKTMEDSDDSLIYRINTGAGFAYERPVFGMVYGLLEAEVDIGGALEGSYCIGGGPSVGILKYFTPFWNGFLFGRSLFFGGGDSHTSSSVGLFQCFRLTRNNHIRAELSHKWEHNYKRFECRLAWQYFF